jgi:hypothetical protein
MVAVPLLDYMVIGWSGERSVRRGVPDGLNTARPADVLRT